MCIRKSFLKVFFVIFICSFIFFNICVADDINLPVWSEQTLQTANVSNEKVDTNNLSFESKAAILMEQSTGKILYEYNSHEKLRPASVTKVMSLLLIMEDLDSGKISLEDKVPCSENARKMGGSQIWLAENEELTVDEMLKAICVVSANDCVVAMSEFISGSEEAFVQRMNEKAKELGMNDTCFKNCHGIDEDGHLTSANDIAIMSREIMTKHPSITKYTTIWMDSLRDGKSELVNTNKLVRNYEGCTGLKTGSTSLALFNLSATATRDGVSLIAVIMGGPNSKIRFSEAQKLLNYGFANYTSKPLCTQDEVFMDIPVVKGTREKIDLIYKDSKAILSKKGEEKQVEERLNMPDVINAPIKKGEVVGKILYVVDGNVVESVDLISSDDVQKLNLGNMMKLTYDSWFNLLRK